MLFIYNSCAFISFCAISSTIDWTRHSQQGADNAACALLHTPPLISYGFGLPCSVVRETCTWADFKYFASCVQAACTPYRIIKHLYRYAKEEQARAKAGCRPAPSAWLPSPRGSSKQEVPGRKMQDTLPCTNRQPPGPCPKTPATASQSRGSRAPGIHSRS